MPLDPGRRVLLLALGVLLESSEPQNKVKNVRDGCSEFERTRTLKVQDCSISGPQTGAMPTASLLNPDSDSKDHTLLTRLLPLWHRENPRDLTAFSFTDSP